MKAAMPVMRPTAISAPHTSSMMPEMPAGNESGGIGGGPEAGKGGSFEGAGNQKSSPPAEQGECLGRETADYDVHRQPPLSALSGPAPTRLSALPWARELLFGRCRNEERCREGFAHRSPRPPPPRSSSPPPSDAGKRRPRARRARPTPFSPERRRPARRRRRPAAARRSPRAAPP